MELSRCVLICVLTSCHLCQLITDLRRCRTYYLYFLTCLCLLSVCSQLLKLNLSLFFRIFQYILDIQREICFISKTEYRTQQTNTQKYVLSCCATKNMLHIEGHLLDHAYIRDKKKMLNWTVYVQSKHFSDHKALAIMVKKP